MEKWLEIGRIAPLTFALRGISVNGKKITVRKLVTIPARPPPPPLAAAVPCTYYASINRSTMPWSSARVYENIAVERGPSDHGQEPRGRKGVNYCPKISRSLPIVVVDSTWPAVPRRLSSPPLGSRGIFRRLIARRIFLRPIPTGR